MKYNTLTGTRADSKQAENISSRFRGNNQLGAKDIFQAKTLYDKEAFSIEGSIDLNDPGGMEPEPLENLYRIFNDTRLPLYGTVDKNVIALEPRKEYLSYYGQNEGGFSALDFVINSYINMKKAYRQGIYEGKGITNGSKLGTIEIVKARDDGQKAIQGNIDLIINQFISFAKQDNLNRKKIITPQNFINYFTNFLLSNSKKLFITYSSFLLTEQIDINFNGLCLDIADVSYENDKDKVKDIILDTNFSYFADAARQFGFLICAEYPFKLIANLNSIKMRDSICVCNRKYKNNMDPYVASAEDIVNSYYVPAYLRDLDYLRNLYLLTYTSFLHNFTIERTNEYYNGHLHSKRIVRFSSQDQFIADSLTDSFLISLYIRLKNSEIRINYTDASLDRFDRTAKILYDKYGFEDTLKYINEKLRLALEAFMPDKKNFVNTENFSVEEALGLIRLSRYNY